MRNPNPVTIQRVDYQPPSWTVPQTRLLFELHPSHTRVSSTLSLRQASAGPLVLDGVDMRLESIAVDGVALDRQNYVLSDDQLIIAQLPSTCTLSIVTVINPESNTALEGLYRSSGNFCTQCEAQGFRKITYYPDRPDVLSTFHVSIIADANEYPVLLSNGNIESTQQLDNGKHCVNWFDPYPKPCYLFALVAGDLAHITERYTTGTGRHIDLFIFVEAHNLDQCQYAMDALKRSMRWDEQVYGLEYDLDRFMIVAVDDFNMGAMENKGLNVFNSKYVLANDNTATDADFLGVESVIAHEYFHNWTGNRVTCRDWFQLSLKEGLTVFRDQQFSADMHSKTVKRIEEVRLLKARQFPEDAGPMAHPIRPDSFIEINNFYTLTVYEKGAEVIRMIHTLLGATAFRSGMDMYFSRHDGQAVTCDDFIDAMQDASGVALGQFRRWYEQAGTPVLNVRGVHDDINKTYTLHVRQQSPDTPGQVNKLPLHIPLKLGLLSGEGRSLPLSTGRAVGDSVVLDVTESAQQFVFENIDAPPVASLLRGFSAPVILEYEASQESLAFQLVHDTDNFNRWGAGQQLATRVIANSMKSGDQSGSLAVLEDALGKVLLDSTLEPAFKAEILLLPSIDTLASSQSVIDIAAIHHARSAVVKSIAHTYRDLFTALVHQSLQSSGCNTAGDRRLANVALVLLTELDSDDWIGQAAEQYWQSGNMTDRVAAASALCSSPSTQRDGCLGDFYNNWQQHKLVLDKWFSIQATAIHDSVLHDIERLRNLPAFDIGNPNRVRALIGAFAHANPVQFHASGGAGYRLVEEFICLLDQSNPQLAARLVTPFLQWQRYCEPQRQLMHETLQHIAARDELSPDVFEVVSKALAQ